MHQIKITAITHQGAVRPHNEDTIAVGSWIRNAPMEEPKQFEHELDSPFLCLIADGMGGHTAGEEASRRAAMVLAESAPRVFDEAETISVLRQLNRSMFDAMGEQNELIGMGTTVAGLILRTSGIIWFNVGDSRIYRYRDNFLRRLSVDDIPDPYVSRDQRSHIITQSIGGSQTFSDISPHTGHEPLRSNWRYLLCSDGITDMLDDNQIEAVMARKDLSATELLFRRSMQCGGVDNISCIIVSIGDKVE